MALFHKAEPPNPVREAVSRHLRIADEFARKRKFDEALFEIEKALKLEPKNNNVRQFYERVKVASKKAQDQQRAKQEAQEFTLDQRMELIPRFLAAADQHIAQHDYKGALAQIAEIYKIDPTNYYAQAYSDRIDQMMTEAAANKKKAFQTAAATSIAPPSQTETEESGSHMFYRELLKEYWFDGKLTEDEQRHLAEVRTLFEITQADHDRLSKEVKFDAYVEALRIAWIDGVLNETERRVLETMRVKYDISGEDNVRAEQYVQSVRKLRPQRDLILIVDSDREHSVAIAKVLRSHSYNPMLAGRPHDAFNYLQKNSPAAIISEVRFPDATMDGFELYRRVRGVATLARTPYIFLVAQGDKDVLHAALRMGVDHVLEKPADPEFIVAALEGKRGQ